MLPPSSQIVIAAFSSTFCLGSLVSVWAAATPMGPYVAISGARIKAVARRWRQRRWSSEDKAFSSS
jgi:hypothetical protein